MFYEKLHRFVGYCCVISNKTCIFLWSVRKNVVLKLVFKAPVNTL